MVEFNASVIHTVTGTHARDCEGTAVEVKESPSSLACLPAGSDVVVVVVVIDVAVDVGWVGRNDM